MDKKLKSILKSQIESYLQKMPHASDGKIIKWLYIGAVPGPDTLNAIKKESLRSFVVYQKKKKKKKKKKKRKLDLQFLRYISMDQECSMMMEQPSTGLKFPLGQLKKPSPQE